MPLGMIGRKIGMTQIFDENGNVVPVTAVLVGPCQILEVKKPEKDGYSAVKIGFEEKVKNLNKAEKGYFDAISKIANKTITPKKLLKEFRVDDIASYNIGDVLNTEFFAANEKVDVIGTTKGKGFQGVVKRWGFHGGPASHGSKFHRKAGSIGAHTFPGRVWKGKKMPGHMGNTQITLKNVKIVKIDGDNSLVLLKGAIPGPTRGIVYLRKQKTAK